METSLLKELVNMYNDRNIFERVNDTTLVSIHNDNGDKPIKLEFESMYDDNNKEIGIRIILNEIDVTEFLMDDDDFADKINRFVISMSGI